MSPELIVGIVVALFGGGGLVALLKLRGENARIVVDAAQGAVIVQSSVIKDLRDQVEKLAERVDALEAERTEAARRAEEAERRLQATLAELAEVRRQRDLLVRANEELRVRLDSLEALVERRGLTEDRPPEADD